jgi:hypothetical protein
MEVETMANYDQLTLFDPETYSSECDTSDVDQGSQVEVLSIQVEYEQLELNLFPKPPKQFSNKKLKRAA